MTSRVATTSPKVVLRANHNCLQTQFSIRRRRARTQAIALKIGRWAYKNFSLTSMLLNVDNSRCVVISEKCLQSVHKSNFNQYKPEKRRYSNFDLLVALMEKTGVRVRFFRKSYEISLKSS